MLRASWCGLAALGAGLILFAAAAGVPAAPAAVLIALASCELAWGALTLRAGRPLAPRFAVAAAGVVVAAVAVMLFSGAIGVLPLLALLALHLSASLLIVLGLRVSERPGPRAETTLPRAQPSLPRFVLLLTAEAMLVAAITTPALAGTAPGEFAVPHGSSHQHR